jgi:hypothetical protein
MSGMRFCFRAAVAATTFLVVAFSLPAQTAPTRKPQTKSAAPVKFIAEVPLLDCGGVPCVEARIGEGKALRLGLDTGDVDSVLDKDLAEAAGLKPTKAMPAGAPAGMFMTEIPTVHVGAATLRNVPTVSLSLTQMIAQKQMPELAGTLAYTAFTDRVVQIDFVAHRVRISEAQTAPLPCTEACDKFSLITFGKKGPLIVVAQGFEINGKNITAQIDTMYTGTLLVYAASIDKLGLAEAAKTQKSENFPFTDGGVDMRVAPAEKESFHGLALGVSAPVVYFPTADVHEPDALFDATVGLGLFYGAVITFDFRGMTISVAKP